MNEQDLKILTNIQKTLEVDPNANQRILAQNSNVSLGMMNAVLKRCIERGWLAVKNLNMKKVCYCLTAQGFEEISRRSSNYIKKSFSAMNDYAVGVIKTFEEAKLAGCKKVVLIGKSNVQFVFEWACEQCKMKFEQLTLDCTETVVGLCNENESLMLVGELLDEKLQKELCDSGCKNIVEMVEL